jgi:hypothetical protein
MGEQGKTIRFGLRLPASLYRKMQERARENDQSINSEIVATLHAALGAKQILSDAEQKLVETEQKLAYMDQELEARFKATGAQLEELRGEMQRIEEWMPVRLPPETSGVIARAEQVAARRGKALVDLLAEALRKVVSEEDPE